MESKGSQGHPALTDAQTLLPNALHWDTVFTIIFAAGDRGIPLTIIVLEVDDSPGWVGKMSSEEVDGTLRALGLALSSTKRQSDLVARIDESRFAYLLLDCNLAGGRLVADRLDGLLQPVRELSGLTFSMGVASYQNDMKRAEELVAAAESALKSGQALGINQIEFYP